MQGESPAGSRREGGFMLRAAERQSYTVVQLTKPMIFAYLTVFFLVVANPAGIGGTCRLVLNHHFR
jgi:hypothetical protein